MKINRLFYVLSAVLFLSVLAFSGFALAEDDRRGEDRGKSEHAKEVHNNGSTLEVHFFDDGKVLVRGAKVTAISDNTVNAFTTWGAVNLNWGVNVLPDTNINRRFGGDSSIAEISVGDFISFQGTLVNTSASPIMVNARVIKDWSVQRKNASFNGTVKSVDSANSKFVLASAKNGDIIVVTSSSTVFKKGDNAGVFADVAVGARILAKGLYNSQLAQISADEVKIHLPEALRTTIEGTIKSIAGVTAPTSMVVTMGDKDYTVNVATDTSVLNSLWLRAPLTSFVVGNKVRVYGTVNANMTIDATVIRNTSIR